MNTSLVHVIVMRYSYYKHLFQLEIKRDVRKISGRVWIQLDYDVNCKCLLVVLLRGEQIVSEACGENRGPNALVMLHLLPNRK